MKKLSKIQIGDLINYVENRLDTKHCDHSLRFSKAWAESISYDFNDLIDVLEANGGFCDCETVMNLPTGEDLTIPTGSQVTGKDNQWKLPKNFSISDIDKQFTKILKATDNCIKNCYAENNELLIPAPFGAKPRKRTRKSVHFFIGLKTGFPNEYGFVSETKPITAKGFAKIIRDSENPDLLNFTEKEADFYLTKLENLKIDTPVGTHFMEKSGLTGKGEEIRIHKIIIR